MTITSRSSAFALFRLATLFVKRPANALLAELSALPWRDSRCRTSMTRTWVFVFFPVMALYFLELWGPDGGAPGSCRPGLFFSALHRSGSGSTCSCFSPWRLLVFAVYHSRKR